jgi:hypothetical protein
MTQILIRHKVNNYTEWKNVFDDFADFRRTSGEKSYRILHPADNNNDLTLLFEWDSQKNAETFLESSELKTAMERAGVAEEPMIQFFKKAEEGVL